MRNTSRDLHLLQNTIQSYMKLQTTDRTTICNEPHPPLLSKLHPWASYPAVHCTFLMHPRPTSFEIRFTGAWPQSTCAALHAMHMSRVLHNSHRVLCLQVVNTLHSILHNADLHALPLLLSTGIVNACLSVLCCPAADNDTRVNAARALVQCCSSPLVPPTQV